MARLARAVAAGVPHHVTQRGNRRQATCRQATCRQATFLGEDDYALYAGLLATWCRRRGLGLLPDAEPRAPDPCARDSERLAQRPGRGAPALHAGDQSTPGLGRSSLAGAVRLLRARRCAPCRRRATSSSTPSARIWWSVPRRGPGAAPKRTWPARMTASSRSRRCWRRSATGRRSSILPTRARARGAAPARADRAAAG